MAKYRKIALEVTHKHMQLHFDYLKLHNLLFV